MALCDVDEARAAANFKKFDKQPKYKDFRVMLEKEGKNIDAVHHRHSGFHARHGGAGLHAARQARLPGEAADADSVGSAPADGSGGQIQSRDADGQPGLLARVQPGGGGDRVVGRHRRCDRSAHLDHARHPSHGSAGAAARIGRARHAGLAGVAGRRGDASVQSVLHAVQLARLPGFRHRADRQLGHPHRGSGPHRAATGRAHQPGVRQRGRREQHHVSGPRHGAGGLPGARRYAAGEGLLSRWAARHRSGSVSTFREWRTRPSCRR